MAEPVPQKRIVEIVSGLWKASIRLGAVEHQYGFFGDREAAARVLAVAAGKLA